MVFQLTSCGNKADFEVKDFMAFTNFESKNDTLMLQMDLSKAIEEGIIIPSGKDGDGSGYFKISFSICNNSDIPKAYHYKLFYQNESYKYNELRINRKDTTYNYLSSENFYGSWENASDAFHKTPEIAADGAFHQVIDSFRIVGNPRDEQVYYGGRPSNSGITEEAIAKKISDIKNSPTWYNQIVDKAQNNNIEISKQLRLDAIWCVKQDIFNGTENNRWKRNPRTGNYSFTLVVTTEEELNHIPYYVNRIDSAESNGYFVNPYSWIKAHIQKDNNRYAILQSKQVLQTKVAFDVSRGVYVNMNEIRDENMNTSFFRDNCGNSDELFRKAHFEQFFHNINKNYFLHNIPVLSDIMTEDFDKLKYNRNLKKFKDEELIKENLRITDCPCKTIGYDSIRKAITISNPGNSEMPYHKENVGIKTRIGFTYGKYTAKIRFPKILNKHHIWNGVTCAFWLINQDENEWNNRRSCYTKGYIPRSIIGRSEDRMREITYSEIDIEIAKDSRYWPKTSYKDGKVPGDDNPAYNHNLIAACTNWDLACNDPAHYDVGALPINYGDNEFFVHRWDHWYKALTSKFEIHHDSIVGGDFYFQIEWKPNEIFFRIGRSKNHMLLIGYMNNSVTAIPNNQMLAVVTQEFHLGEWWPTSPFQQNYIPFQKSDIKGEVLEIEIE